MGSRILSLGIGAMVLLSALTASAAEALVARLEDQGKEPVAGAVVYLRSSAPVAAGEPAPAVVDQVDKAFVPAVTVVQIGAEVQFPNSDEVSHHVYSFAQPNAFELPLYKGQARPTVRFDEPGLVTLGCNIHDSMLGYIMVVDTPYFGVTDNEGQVVIEAVPAGDFEVVTWSPRLDATRTLSLGQISLPARRDAPLALQAPARQKDGPSSNSTTLAWDDY